MNCQSCGLLVPPTTQVCPRCRQPIAPNTQPAQNQYQRSNLPSTEQFPWQGNNNVAAQQPPLHWNNENRVPAPNAAPFGPVSQANSEPIQMYPASTATNFNPNQMQGGFQNAPQRPQGFPSYPQTGNQQPMPSQGPDQSQAQGYAQPGNPQRSDPVQPQAFNQGTFSPPMQTGPVQPQAFNQGTFPPPTQSGPVQPQMFKTGALPPGPMQSGPIQMQNFGQGAFSPPIQSSPVQLQNFNQGAFSPPMQASPVQPQAFNSMQAPYAAQAGPVQQRSSAGIVRSAGIIHSDHESSKRKIFIGIGAGFLAALLVAVGYLAFLQKPATQQQAAIPTPQVAQTHTKNLPKQPPLTITDPQELYTQATGRQAAINDSLHMQSDNNWQSVNSPGNCTFDANTLHAVTSTADVRTTMCIATATKYQNIAFQAQLTTIKGDTSGLIVRADNKGQRLYLFSITTTGMYTLAVTDGQNGTQQHVLAGGTSAAIKQGLNQENQLTIIARDSTLYLYINQKFIAKMDDKTNTTGCIGLFEGNSQGDTSEARFTNVKVWNV